MRRLLLVFLVSLAGPPEYAVAQETTDLPATLPAAVVDLRTAEGARLVGATWRYSDVAVVEVDHREPGADLRPSGAPNRTNDITPHAGAADFDDSGWTPHRAGRRWSPGAPTGGWPSTGTVPGSPCPAGWPTSTSPARPSSSSW